MLSGRCTTMLAFPGIIPTTHSGPRPPPSCTVMGSMSSLSWRSLVIGPLQFTRTKGHQTSSGSLPAIASLPRTEQPLRTDLCIMTWLTMNGLSFLKLALWCIVIHCIVFCIVNTLPRSWLTIVTCYLLPSYI